MWYEAVARAVEPKCHYLRESLVNANFSCQGIRAHTPLPRALLYGILHLSLVLRLLVRLHSPFLVLLPRLTLDWCGRSFGIFCHEVFTRAAVPYEGMTSEVVWLKVIACLPAPQAAGALRLRLTSPSSPPVHPSVSPVLRPKLKAGYRLPCPAGCPADVHGALMLRSWSTDPADRPTFRDLVQLLEQAGSTAGRERFVDVVVEGIRYGATMFGSDATPADRAPSAFSLF